MRLCNAFILDLFYMQWLVLAFIQYANQGTVKVKANIYGNIQYSFYPICFLRNCIPILDMKWYSFSHPTLRKQLSTVLTIVDLFL